MLTIVSALIPVMMIIALGVFLKRTALFSDESWNGFGNLCYFVLFPVLLIKILATVKVESSFLFAYAAMVLLVVLTMSLLLVLVRPLLVSRYRIRGSSFSSFFQGVTRWHGFVALSIVGILYGDDGVAYMAIIMAIIIPPLNVINVIVLVKYAHGSADMKSVVTKVFSNPFILACALGVSLNVLGVTLPGPLFQAMDIIGGGALGLSLFTVGAGLRFSAVKDNYELIGLGSLTRLLGMPALMFAGGWLFGIDGMPLVVAVIAGGVPTATAAYILAKQMGGDDVLMANLITVQVVLSGVTLPVMIWLAG